MDDLIDDLIRISGAFNPHGKRRRFVGGGWADTSKLKPTGDAERATVLAERLNRQTERREQRES
jgi:hypothetical protein